MVLLRIIEDWDINTDMYKYLYMSLNVSESMKFIYSSTFIWSKYLASINEVIKKIRITLLNNCLIRAVEYE